MFDRLKVKTTIAKFLKTPAEKVQDSVLLTDLVRESMILIEMVIELQEVFSIRLIQDDLKDVRTVGNLLDVMQSKVK